MIDNGAPRQLAASQVYFVNLNGADAGNTSAATSSVCDSVTGATIINAVQAQQSNP